MDQMTCFAIFATFLTATIWQSVIMLAISVDLLCAIVFPILYRKWMTNMTVTINVMVCAALSLVYSVFVYDSIDSTKPSNCNTFNIAMNVSSCMNVLQYCIFSSQMLVYVICYVIMYIRGR
uniref:G_PROTEIN_RECEP_F1_2 domain-containing protein n=1 Tax=Angiostrongylus cantonensis TaxID=6313 RepID=A0A0K0D2K8_ANGCA